MTFESANLRALPFMMQSQMPSNMTFQMPAMPMSMPTGMINTPLFNSPWSTGGGWGNSSTSSASEDSYEARIKKREEEGKKRIVDEQFLKEKNEEISKTRDLIEAQTKMIDDIKKGKKSDGRSIIEGYKLQEPTFDENGKIKKAEKPKKGFWEKAGAWLGSAGSALKNMGKSFIGYDKDGKWKLGNCLKNIAITAAAIGACFIPVVGPAIGYGLLAYGVASGGYGVYKGVKKLNKAKTAEEEEIARQEICSGTIVGVASAVGMRGLGKAFRTGASASSSTATAATSTTGKIAQGVSNFAKDMTINAVKGTAQAMRADQALIAAKGGGFSGFTKAFGSKISNAWSGFNNWEKLYDAQYKKMETSLNNQISELNTQISAETNAVKKALLQEQKTMLESNLTELRSMSGIKTKTEFDNMRTTNSATKNQEQLGSYTECSRGYEVNGQRVSQQRFDTFKSEVEAMQKQYNKDLQSLIDKKECTMRQYAAKPKKHTRELNEYTQQTIRKKYNTPEKLKTGMETLSSKIADFETKIADLEAKISRTTNPRRLRNLNNQLNIAKAGKTAAESELSVCSSIKFSSKYKPSTWRKNEYQLYIGGKNPGKFLETTRTALQQPAVVAPMSMAQWNRQFEISMLGDLVELTPEQTKEYITQLEKQKAELEKSLDMLNEIKDVSQWNQLKAMQKQQQEEMARAAEQQQQQQQQEN